MRKDDINITFSVKGVQGKALWAVHNKWQRKEKRKKSLRRAGDRHTRKTIEVCPTFLLDIKPQRNIYKPHLFRFIIG